MAAVDATFVAVAVASGSSGEGCTDVAVTCPATGFFLGLVLAAALDYAKR